MKPSFLVIAGLVLGIGVGIGMTISQLSGSSSGIAPVAPTERIIRDDGAVIMPPPFDAEAKLELDHATYNFGAMEKGEKNSHVFTFRSVGTKPLVLVRGETTCKCTLSSFGDDGQRQATIEPGESLDVTLSWEAKDNANPSFRQTAVIFSNDKSRDRLVLTIEGKIEQSIVAIPSSLQAGELTQGETKTIEGFIISNRTDNLTVVEHRWLSADNASLFDVSFEPLSAVERDAMQARSAVRLRVTVKPGLPAGSIQQALEVKTNLEGTPPINVHVLGSVQGNMKLNGRGYRSFGTNSGIVDWGHIKKGEGAELKFRILLRGPERDKIKLRTGTVRPESLQVTFGEPRPLNESVTEVPLTITLPKDAPVMQFSGLDGSIGGETQMPREDKSALVVVESDHAEYGQHRLMLRLTVGN